MTDDLSLGQIKSRSLRGARWLVILNVFGLPAVYATQLMLGRTGEEALGAYALVQVLVGVLITFSVFGGEMPLRNFIAKAKNPVARGQIFQSYLLVVLLMCSIVWGIFLVFPQSLQFLLPSKAQLSFPLLMSLTVSVVLGEVLIALAAGLMAFTTATIARQTIRLVTFPTVLGYFFLDQEYLKANTTTIIFTTIFAAYSIGIVLCGVTIWRDSRFRLTLGWKLPQGFWAFSLTSYVAALGVFCNGQFDRICVFGQADLVGLGVYQATISVVALLDYFPRRLSAQVLPVFSTLLAQHRGAELMKAYEMVQRNGIIAIAAIALPTIAFSAEILGVFGEGYATNFPLLSCFSVSAVVVSLYLANTPLLLALEKNSFRLYVVIVQILIQVVGTLCFIGTYGVAAVAAAKMAGVIVAQVATMAFVVYFLGLGITVSRAYKAAVVVAIVSALIRVYILPTGWLGAGTLATGSCLVFWLLAGLSISELSSTFRRLKETR